MQDMPRRAESMFKKTCEELIREFMGLQEDSMSIVQRELLKNEKRGDAGGTGTLLDAA